MFLITKCVVLGLVVGLLVYIKTRDEPLRYFDVLLTVHLSIILVNDQLNAQILVL